MKATITAIAMLCSLQAAFAQTTYRIFFSDYVEITEAYSDDAWYGDGAVKVKVWPGHPARLIVSTDTSRHYLTLYASEQKKVDFIFPFKDLEVQGHTFEGGTLEPRQIPQEGRANFAVILIILAVLAFA